MRLMVATFVVVALLVMPRASAAQSPTEQQLTSVVKLGERVRITLADGAERRGKLRLVKPDALELNDGGLSRVIALSQIRRVEVDLPDPVSDSAKRGAWIGLAVGGGVGALFAIAFCDGFDDCAGSLTVLGVLGGMGAGIGAAAGALGDALITDTRVAWPTTAAVGPARPFNLGVLASPRRLGVKLTIRW